MSREDQPKNPQEAGAKFSERPTPSVTSEIIKLLAAWPPSGTMLNIHQMAARDRLAAYLEWDAEETEYGIRSDSTDKMTDLFQPEPDSAETENLLEPLLPEPDPSRVKALPESDVQALAGAWSHVAGLATPRTKRQYERLKLLISDPSNTGIDGSKQQTNPGVSPEGAVNASTADNESTEEPIEHFPQELAKLTGLSGLQLYEAAYYLHTEAGEKLERYGVTKVTKGMVVALEIYNDSEGGPPFPDLNKARISAQELADRLGKAAQVARKNGLVELIDKLKAGSNKRPDNMFTNSFLNQFRDIHQLFQLERVLRELGGHPKP